MNRSNEDAEAVMAMTPDQRIERAFELGRRGVELYMSAHHVDRETLRGHHPGYRLLHNRSSRPSPNAPHS
jgi:hypothetical protein